MHTMVHGPADARTRTAAASSPGASGSPPWATEFYAAQVAWQGVAGGGPTGASLVGDAAHDALHGTWCLTKPLAGVVFAALHEQGVLDLDEPIDEVAGISLRRWRPTAAALLAHRHDLRAPGLALARTLRPSARMAQVAETCDDPAPTFAYSEYVPWQLLSWHVLERAGRSLTGLIRSVVLGPLGLDGSVLMPETPEEVLAAADRIAPVYAGLGGGQEPVALVHDRGPFIPSADASVFGGLTSATGMVGFGSAVLRRLRGEQDDGDPPMTELASRLEQAGAARSRFCLGFSLCLPARFGAGTIGHLGWANSSVFVIDPARSRTISCIANTMSLDPVEQTMVLPSLFRIGEQGCAP